MQKENLTEKGVSAEEINIQRATSETNINISDGSLEAKDTAENKDESQSENAGQDNCSQFEDLIKGPFKDAFTKKVQSIIDKRFKEQKIAEAKKTSTQANGSMPQFTPKSPEEGSLSGDGSTDAVYENLIEAGIDPEIAYRVLHLDEIMDSSMRYGAELAAKHLADSIRQKSARPTETAVSKHSLSTKVGVGSLTPEKRKELAKKALMGEHIGF